MGRHLAWRHAHPLAGRLAFHRGGTLASVETAMVWKDGEIEHCRCRAAVCGGCSHEVNAPRRCALATLMLAVLGVCGCGPSVRASHAPDFRRPQRVVVLPFAAPPDVVGHTDTVSIGREATDGCLSALRQANVEVVPRERVAAAMADAHVAAVDDATAASLARMVGADATILGAVSVRKFSVDVDVRLVRAENGTVGASAHAQRESVFGRDACAALDSGGLPARR